MLTIDTGLLGSISSPRARLLVDFAASPLAISYVTVIYPNKHYTPLAIALGLGFDDNLGFDSIELSRGEL